MRFIGILVGAILWFLAVPGQAADLQMDGQFVQGGYAMGYVSPGSRVDFDGLDVPVGVGGDFFIGFHRDEQAEPVLKITHTDGRTEERTLSIKQRSYDIQRIDGLPDKKVTPPPEVTERIAADAALVAKARARRTPKAYFESGWMWPCVGPISGVFGSQRILNGQPRQPHYGVDIAAPLGTPVVAPADGVVSLTAPDMYFSGATLMIDHGRGLASAFLHLQSIEVSEGQFVRKGDRIATLGGSGRATGPHLDWRINWFDKRLDAELFVGPMPTE